MCFSLVWETYRGKTKKHMNRAWMCVSSTVHLTTTETPGRGKAFKRAEGSDLD